MLSGMAGLVVWLAFVLPSSAVAFLPHAQHKEGLHESTSEPVLVSFLCYGYSWLPKQGIEPEPPKV